MKDLFLPLARQFVHPVETYRETLAAARFTAYAWLLVFLTMYAMVLNYVTNPMAVTEIYAQSKNLPVLLVPGVPFAYGMLFGLYTSFGGLLLSYYIARLFKKRIDFRSYGAAYLAATAGFTFFGSLVSVAFPNATPALAVVWIVFGTILVKTAFESGWFSALGNILLSLLVLVIGMVSLLAAIYFLTEKDNLRDNRSVQVGQKLPSANTEDPAEPKFGGMEIISLQNRPANGPISPALFEFPKRGINGATYGFINTSGKEVIKPIFKAVGDFRGGLAPVAFESRWWGYIDQRGAMAIKPGFEEVTEFSEGKAFVKNKEGWMAIGTKGQKLFSVDADHVAPYVDGLARFRKNELWGFIDAEGRVAIPAQFKTLGNFSEGLAPALNQQDRSGFIDKSGKFALPAKFGSVQSFAEGVSVANLGSGKNIYVDKNGRQAVPGEFAEANRFSEGLAFAGERGRLGLIDRQGKWVIKPKFVMTNEFSEGLAAVSENFKGPWTYIDKTGAKVFDIFGEFPGPFHHGVAKVVVKDGDLRSTVYFDKTGTVIWKQD